MIWSSNRHGQWDGDGRWGFLSEVASWKISHIHWVKYPQRYQARASLEDTNLFPGQLFKTRGVSNKNRLSYPQIIQVVLENVPLPSGSQSGWKSPHNTMIFPWKKNLQKSLDSPAMMEITLKITVFSCLNYNYCKSQYVPWYLDIKKGYLKKTQQHLLDDVSYENDPWIRPGPYSVLIVPSVNCWRSIPMKARHLCLATIPTWTRKKRPLSHLINN